MFFLKNKKNQIGISIIEIVVCVAIFAVLSVSIFGIFSSVVKGIIYYREKAVVSSLAKNYIEIVRNMPYSQIGTLSGNPHGVLSDLPNPINNFINGRDYQIYYSISYVDDPADGTIIAGTDPAPNDYKQVKLYIKNTQTETINSFLTNVSPKGLEGMSNGGAFSIKVFDAVGQPVSGATIHIENYNVSPNINLTRTTDSSGNWIEVGLPDSSNSYRVSVSKSGYSTDQTYPVTIQNPDPVKPYATILNGQVTQVSFSIDKLSDLAFKTLSQSCSPMEGIGLDIKGSKLIGTPDVLKFDNSYFSDSNGQVILNNIEWDNYTPSLASFGYMIYGSSPIQEVNIFPDTSQNFSLILGPKTSYSLLVIVKDSSTGNPVEGALVNLQSGTDSFSGYTNGSVWSQQDWSGGSGQSDFIDSSKYLEDDGNINANNLPLALRLNKIGDDYVSSGSLISSTFDTGTDETSYTTLMWEPTSQDPATEIKFQIAANNDNSTWNFIGPDGTAGSYYTVPGTTITNANNNRYIKYKVFLSTTEVSKTPVLTSVNINYVSGCFTPGQVMFPNLEKKTYELTISMAGYQQQVISGIEVKGYEVSQVLLNH